MARFYQGKFQPINPSKYTGDPSNIVYRSSWELAALKWLDECKDVTEYGSEEIVIPYLLEGADGTNKLHRYFPDLYVKFTNGTKIIVEIKPFSQTKLPILKKGMKKNKYMREYITFKKNVAKWQAAMAYCRANDMIFRVWTEKTLYEMTGFRP